MALSRKGKQIIQMGSGVDVKLQEDQITVKGQKGEIKFDVKPGFDLNIDGNTVQLVMKEEDRRNRLKPFHGLYASLLRNAVMGVTEGYVRTLQLVGVGYRAQMKGETLSMTLGYSHPVEFTPPAGITIEAPDQTTIHVRGIDKQLVGQVAANIRAFREPEPYKGKGVLYAGEVVRRKAGKTGKK